MNARRRRTPIHLCRRSACEQKSSKPGGPLLPNEVEDWNFADDSLSRSDRACGPGVESHAKRSACKSVETIHGWMPKRLRRTDISQTHKHLQSLRKQCPQAIWSLGAAFEEMNHHLHAQKSNLTSHFLYKNIKRTFEAYLTYTEQAIEQSPSKREFDRRLKDLFRYVIRLA